MQAEYDSPASPRLRTAAPRDSNCDRDAVISCWCTVVVSLYPPSFVFARGTSFVPAGSILSGMEEARSSGSGKENSSTQSSNWTSYKATEESRWHCQIETEADTLGTWALRWEAAEAKSMRECISFTYPLTNLTVPSARVSDKVISRTRINNLF